MHEPLGRLPDHIHRLIHLVIFGRGRAELKAWRAAIGGWLMAERGLRLKHPEAPVLRTAGHLDLLGYRVTRAGFEPHRRVQRRLERRVREAWGDAARVDVERSIGASAGVVLF